MNDVLICLFTKRSLRITYFLLFLSGNFFRLWELAIVLTQGSSHNLGQNSWYIFHFCVHIHFCLVFSSLLRHVHSNKVVFMIKWSSRVTSLGWEHFFPYGWGGRGFYWTRLKNSCSFQYLLGIVTSKRACLMLIIWFPGIAWNKKSSSLPRVPLFWSFPWALPAIKQHIKTGDLSWLRLYGT